MRKKRDWDIEDIFSTTMLLIFIAIGIMITILLAMFVVNCFLNLIGAKETKAEAMQVQIISGTKIIKQEEEPIEVHYFDCPLDTDLQDYIRETCNFYDVPMDVVISIISCESGFQPDVISPWDDYGLMQINKINHEWLNKELGVTDFLDPKQNVLCGIHLFSQHWHETDKNLEYALLRYNCGTTGGRNLWESGIHSTQYTQKIISAYQYYKEV